MAPHPGKRYAKKTTETKSDLTLVYSNRVAVILNPNYISHHAR